MNKGETIRHKGKIVDITPEYTTIEIIAESACASCHAKSLCGLSESRTKAVQVPTSGFDTYSPGDEVTLELSASMGHKAVWIAYVAPLAVLFAVLMLLTSAGIDELYCGIAAIASVAVYYFVIWLLRGVLKNEYVFKIVK